MAKTNLDLARFVQAKIGSGFLYGAFGRTLTETLLQAKLMQFPAQISVDLPEIRSRWMGCSVCDDIGLVKWFFWDRPDGSVGYATEGFPDITSGTLFYRARIKGPLSALPELPGLALWRNGHMGIYIGRGALVEAKDAGSGVVQSCLSDRDFTHWFKIPGLYYLSI